MVTAPSSMTAAVRLWVVFWAFCACAGWLLSLIGWLNAAGYTVVFLLGAVGAAVFRHQLLLAELGCRFPRRRFRRLFPACFLVLLVAATLGGLLYAPSNPDGLTHRVPRTLNWLAAERWHWIENAPTGFNTRATGFEWLMAPQLSLLRTDRFVFLLNILSFAFLPGLVYSSFWRLGVRKRVAWHWMWLVPTGYCFLLQAGSIANDLAGAVISLAALDFALRARRSGRLSDVWFAILAAGLMTNAKASNLTLLLPWGLALLPSLRLLARKPVRSVAVILIALTVSLVPNTWFNIRKLGDWSGSKVEAPQFSQLTPGVAFVGNTLNLAAQNFVPPIFPVAGWWNENLHRALPAPLLRKLEAGFEPGGAHVKLMELQLEVAAGLGLGVSLLLVISVCSALATRTIGRRPHSLPAPGGADPSAGQGDWWLALVRWSGWFSLLVYMVATGLSTSGRLIAPYYCFLIPSLLALPGHALLVRLRWWRALGMFVFAMAAVLLAMNPGRPLWPAERFFSWLSARSPGSGALRKAALLYDSYSGRWDALAPIRNHVPADATNVGFISFISASSIETSLWRPFGLRRIWWLQPSSQREELRRKGIRFVIVGTEGPEARKGERVFRSWLVEWLRDNGGRIVAEERIRLLATGNPTPWYLVEFP